MSISNRIIDIYAANDALDKAGASHRLTLPVTGPPVAVLMPAAQADADAYKALCADLLEALKTLRIDANRLCDRMLGGTYEDDCRRSIARADAIIAEIEGR